ncbi:unnamed protein product [Penicillium egyptiacum]|uniref:NAD(P)-binding domain-containing protein n=1 Tax=Penicillium egyptiacum TaxID=1303716 RepID=A0A9W4KA90_9EURO|nr:unnamed protein product [Penicillium egyptiacum]
MSRQIKNVVLAGATGALGSHILTGLVSHGGFNLTILTRNAAGTLPVGATAKVVDFSSVTALAAALQGQDAVVDAISSPDPSVSMRLIDAAVTAGVYRYIAPEFSGDPKNDKGRALPVFGGKKQIYEHLQKVASEDRITWTAISNGAFLDWCLRTGFVNIDLFNKKVALMNDGSHVFPWTTLPAVGTAVCNALTQAEKTKNQTLFIYSVQKSQKDILAIAKDALGAENWETQSQDMEAALEEAMIAVKSGDYSWKVMGDLIRYSISTPGYSGRLEQDNNDLLGVRPMSDEQVKTLIQQIFDELKTAKK